MKEYLNKPFPFVEKKKHKVLVSILFSIFIYVFLLTFQPFGISTIQYYKGIFIAGFSGISFIVLMLSFFVTPIVLKKKLDLKKWNIKSALIFIIVQFLIITILNWTYNSIVGKDITEQHSLLFFVFITTSVGIIPTFFLIYFIEKHLTPKNQYIASHFVSNINTKTSIFKNEIISLLSKNNNETITICLKDFLCIKSEGNYLNVYFLDNNKTTSKLIRNSISNIEEQFRSFEQIKRCHRSFLVNLDKVEHITGNARRLNLHVPNLNFTIPVSRTFPKEILKKFNP